MVFGFSDVSMIQKTISFIFGDTTLEIQVCEHVGKDVRRIILKIRLKSFWKSWIWDQHLPENMRWLFGNIGSISSKTLNSFLKFWSIETLKDATLLLSIEGFPYAPQHIRDDIAFEECIHLISHSSVDVRRSGKETCACGCFAFVCKCTCLPMC